tara:strand:+ start:630 stop:989 length:360 start_codon:yes stop_codon:yes gene_type:complete
MTNKIPFGFRFNHNSMYNYSEVSNFIECSDGIACESDRKIYITFLDELLSGNIKPSTMVDIDTMWTFYRDLDNRASIDYREGHWNDTPSIVRGGKYFDRLSRKMKQHIESYGITVREYS